MEKGSRRASSPYHRTVDGCSLLGMVKDMRRAPRSRQQWRQVELGYIISVLDEQDVEHVGNISLALP